MICQNDIKFDRQNQFSRIWGKRMKEKEKMCECVCVCVRERYRETRISFQLSCFTGEFEKGKKKEKVK